ncbi:Lrp/AsnC family transcriptional regulator [Rodentibacter pneumotropicus]|uniref:Lrp/AsnC family transcriptional regulator n=3 Tax=Rodentibacter pneumotropicus TaxID=758 RepID=A0A448MQW5_9PAST|nr:Lrp/AsnC family transcriptional regulator [Rodentibacter pneumotropicus]MCQ9121120.1 Lrp/AsnC family transcriptional regulator [Rodentibacter pneumotropicus]MDC2824434.1 Lrp/AsnC family transcriptional regulator [Rodentibacter pneumotropicus]MDC2826663.1 Lrp/AsnC family transcriptional regulator [Rodentibacter pneumotropicus]VEH67534.1 regulatory protein AsnC [Rodentibacter pneumotropicus]
MSILDETNQKLLSLLRENARYSIAFLAKKLKVSRATVVNRIARLEKEGVILGYRVELHSTLESDGIKAWTTVIIDGGATAEVVQILRGEPCINAIYDTNGRWDILIELIAPSLEELGQALERIRSIKAITSSETYIHLKRYA